MATNALTENVTPMNFELILCEVKDRVAYITMNRPEKRNALNPQLVRELGDAFLWAELDDDVKVVVLQGAGKAFCAGADLSYIQQLQGNDFQANLDDSLRLKALFHRIYTHKKVVIAKVNGHAIAGGCGLATVCDFVYSVPEAKFGYTEVHIGFVPAVVMIFLIRKIGEAKAKELLLTGQLISSERAQEYGMVNRVYTVAELEEEVEAFAQRLCRHNSTDSMAITKKMIAEVPSMSIDSALHYAAEMNARSRSTDDCKRGIASFLAKENLEW